MIGKMRERVTIQKNAATRTNGVRTADSWTALETVYGRLRPLSASSLVGSRAPYSRPEQGDCDARSNDAVSV